jgi:DNA-binding beta-propeller fold protein YncE
MSPAWCVTALLCGSSIAAAADSEVLSLEAQIPLGTVRGRIDHIAIDVARQRLFVAELGNDSLGLVDLRVGRTLTTVTGLHEPQGVGYVPSTDTIWVANGGDGTLRLYRGEDGRSDGILPVGTDADNVRVDAQGSRVYVGYGSGGVAIFDAVTRERLATIALGAHPEGLELDEVARHLYVNVPGARHIAVIDLSAGRQSAAWAMSDSPAANFPLAIDREGQRLLVGYRSPAMLIVHDLRNGAALRKLPICGDTDDIAWDAERQLAYAACGEGFIDVIDLGRSRAQRVARIPTVKGARTSLYSQELDRLYIAVRATGQLPAAIWVFRPGCS